VKTRIGWAAFGLLLLLAAVAHADRKVVSANNCLLMRDSDAGEYHDNIYDRGGLRIGYHGPGFLGVVCPLFRSKTTSTGGLSALKVNVQKYQTGGLLCYAESSDMNGSVLKSVTRTITSTGIRSLNWSNSLNTSSSKGTYGILCYLDGAVLPAKADELFSIDYTEL